MGLFLQPLFLTPDSSPSGLPYLAPAAHGYHAEIQYARNPRDRYHGSRGMVVLVYLSGIVFLLECVRDCTPREEIRSVLLRGRHLFNRRGANASVRFASRSFKMLLSRNLLANCISRVRTANIYRVSRLTAYISRLSAAKTYRAHLRCATSTSLS